jgi:hypothetical protein
LKMILKRRKIRFPICSGGVERKSCWIYPVWTRALPQDSQGGKVRLVIRKIVLYNQTLIQKTTYVVPQYISVIILASSNTSFSSSNRIDSGSRMGPPTTDRIGSKFVSQSPSRPALKTRPPPPPPPPPSRGFLSACCTPMRWRRKRENESMLLDIPSPFCCVSSSATAVTSEMADREILNLCAEQLQNEIVQFLVGI